MSAPSTSSRPAFWKPGSRPPASGSSVDRSSEAESFLSSSLPSSSATALPIRSSASSILHALESHQVLILVSPTGTGKTTLLPPLLHSSGWTSSNQLIACTQPRRIAAISAATHVSATHNTMLGDLIGYTIRFEENTSPSTRILYTTDGMLFRELLRDPLLTRYSVIMVDEAHERSISTDLLLGVLKKVLRKRRELRVIVSSATIDAQVFYDFFTVDSLKASSSGKSETDENVKIIQLTGRSHPVSIAYLAQPCKDYVQETIETIWRIHLAEPRGDILAFLTGREEIESAVQTLADRQLDLPSGAARMHLLPLHSGLSAAEQSEIFQPSPSASLRKVVVATNIAEASITLDGVVYVIDSGLVKLRANETLSVVPISKASAAQRAGRAGRTQPGKCFRLYTEQYFHNSMSATTPPELNRTDLAGPILMLKALGIDNLVCFSWVPPSPPPENLARGLAKLVALGALDEYARLTEVGGWMAELPLPPHLARILIEGARKGCATEVLSILAMTQVTSPWYAPDSAETQLSQRNFTAQQGDHFTLLNIFLTFIHPRVGKKSAKWCGKHRLNFAALSRAVSIRNQLEKYLLRFKLNPASSVEGEKDAVEKITRVLCTGLYANLARWDEVKMLYRTAAEGREVRVHPTSVLFNRRPDKGKIWAVYGKLEDGGGGKTFIRDITVLDDLVWVTEAVEGYYDVKTQWGRAGARDAAIPTTFGGEYVADV